MRVYRHQVHGWCVQTSGTWVVCTDIRYMGGVYRHRVHGWCVNAFQMHAISLEVLNYMRIIVWDPIL